MDVKEYTGIPMSDVEVLLGRDRRTIGKAGLLALLPYQEPFRRTNYRLYSLPVVQFWKRALAERDRLMGTGATYYRSSLTKGPHVNLESEEARRVYQEAADRGYRLDAVRPHDGGGAGSLPAVPVEAREREKALAG